MMMMMMMMLDIWYIYIYIILIYIYIPMNIDMDRTLQRRWTWFFHDRYMGMDQKRWQVSWWYGAISKWRVSHHDMEWGSWPRSSGLKPPSGGDSIPKEMILRRKNMFPPAMQQFHYYLLLDLPIKNRHSYIMVYPNFPMFLLCVSYFAQKFCMNIPWFSQVITASPWQLAQYLVADASHRRLLLSAAARSAATAAWELAEAGVRCSTFCPFFWATIVKQQI